MRRLVITPTVLTLAAVLAGCGQPQTKSQDANAQATNAQAAAEQPAAPSPAALTPEQMKQVQTTLPAPFNTADLANGQAKYVFCQSCHTITPGGPSMTGPNLHGVVGRKAGTATNYNFSEALKASGVTWDAATLDTWITNPRTMVPGNKMTFMGMKDPKDRTDLIAYLMVNSAPPPQ